LGFPYSFPIPHICKSSDFSMISDNANSCQTWKYHLKLPMRPRKLERVAETNIEKGTSCYCRKFIAILSEI
jgi:hypothetical protein